MKHIRNYGLRVVSTVIFASFFFPGYLEGQASRYIYEARELPKGRAFHGSAVMGDYLYVFGGASTTRESDVEGKRGLEEQDSSVLKAQILPGGQLGEWETISPLPKNLNYIGSSTITLNDVVYIVGGSSLPANGIYYDTAIWSKPLPDGSLMPWRESRPFADKLAIMTAVTTPEHIHIIGGLRDTEGSTPDQRTPSVKVFSNQIHSDGTMSEWVEGPEMPFGLWYHSAGVVAGRVYVWGGLNGATVSVNTTSSVVLSCPILATGKLGPWRQESTLLSQGMYSASSAVAGPYLLSFSPRYPSVNGTEDGSQSIESSDVWWSYVTPNGLIPWNREQTTIPNRLYHSITPDYRRGSIYVIGGRPKRSMDYTRKVQYFTLSPAARSAVENQWANAQNTNAASVSTFDTLAQQNTSSDGQQGTDQLSYLADNRLSVGAVSGFLTINEARKIADDPIHKKPLIMYFNSKDALPCIEQHDILQRPEFLMVSNQAAFAWLNSREYPQLAQQLGVYRVPTWIFFDKNGNEVSRTTNVLPVSEIIKIVSALP